MFKRLRERIAEEATKFPVGQLANNAGKPLQEPENKSMDANSTEDLITLSDSSSVVVPHTSPQQFSIGEEEDGSLSEQSTPQKKQNASTAETNVQHASKDLHSDLGLGQEYRPKKFSYVPQSDIESEKEDPPTLNLDGISKDQLMAIIQSLKARSYKYKNKYAEVVKNYKELREEKTKIENALIESQDKGVRRIAELREQCQLEQNAKAHLEEMLRLLLEEKDSRISVLETQINLLKEAKSGSTKTLPEDCENPCLDVSSGDTRSEDSTTSINSDVTALQEKVERLQHQHNQDKKTVTSQKDQISLLKKQNENLSIELEDKVKRLNNMEDEHLKLRSEHELVLRGMQDRLKELEKQQEENIMSMAETKRNMHEELELKEKQLVKAEEEAKQYQVEAEKEKGLVSELKKQHEEKVKELCRQLEVTEKTLEEEKQSLLHELGQGKTAAINLMQQECAKKISAIEEEWKSKYEALQSEIQTSSLAQIEELSKSLRVVKDKLKESDKRIEELDSLVVLLEKENASLKNSVEKLESEVASGRENYEKLKVSYSDYEYLKEKGNLLKAQELINSELNDKIAKYIHTEEELQIMCSILKDQLSEQKTLIANLENEKSNLIDKIKILEISVKEKETICDNLKNEILSLNECLKNQTNHIDNVISDNNTKSEEIEELKKQLKSVLLNEKLVSEKLSLSVNETTEFEAENAELLQDNRLLKDKIESLKSVIISKDKQLLFLNENISQAVVEIKNLNETLEMKENMLNQAVISYKQIESLVSSLEHQQNYLKSTCAEFENVCELVFGMSCSVSDQFELIKKQKLKSCVIFSNKSICTSDISQNNLIENDPSVDIVNNSKELSNVCKEKDFQETDISEDMVILPMETLKSNTEPNIPHSDLINNSETMNIESLIENIAVLEREKSALKEELNTCKNMSELQNIEFAKNITILHQSLNDLQEERNILSLVSQNIENTQENRDKLRKEILSVEKEDLEDSENNFKHDWEIRIAELNSKVKAEIDALSSQTEVVNKELHCIREQFKSNQESYSEKLMQLNSKLLFRTEMLLNLREEFDISVESANYLKELLEKMELELDKKSNMVNSLENDKKELENKCINLKEKYLKRECDLKETHNSQLVELKNQTKSTIDKLNEQIKQSSKQLEEKDEEMNLKIGKIKERHMKEINNYKNEVMQCKSVMDNFGDINSIESKVMNCASKLDIYCSKIIDLSSKINKFACMVKRKDEEISFKNNSILELEEKLKNYEHLGKEFNDLQNELSSTAQLLCDAHKELDIANNKIKSLETDNSKLKTEYESAIEKYRELLSTKSDADKLQSLLELTTHEIESLNVKYSEINTCLNDKDSQLQKLNEKYKLVVADVERLNKLLDAEKAESELQKRNACEFSEKCNNFMSEIESLQGKYLADVNDKNVQLQELNKKYNSALNDNNNLKKLLNTQKDESELLKNEANKLSDKFNSISIEFESLQIQNAEVCTKLSNKDSELQEINEKYKSALKNVEGLNQLTNVQKIELELQKNIHFELSNKCTVFASQLENILIELDKHAEKTVEALNEKDSQLKNVELKFLALSSQYKSQVEEITDLKNKLASCLKDLDEYKAFIEEDRQALNASEKTILEWQSKYEDLLLKIKEISNSAETTKWEYESVLKTKKEQLATFEILVNDLKLENDSLSLQIAEIPILQDRLSKSAQDVQAIEEKLNEQKERITTVENDAILEWKSKYENAVARIHEMSSATEIAKNEYESLLEVKSLQLATIETNMCDLKRENDTLKMKIEEIPVLQDKLNKNIEALQACEKFLDEHQAKVTNLEKEKLNLKQLYKTTLEDLQKLSNDSLVNKENSAQLIVDLEAKIKENNNLTLQVKKLQDNLNKSTEDLQVLKNLFNDKIENFKALENEHLELKHKNVIAVNDVQNLSCEISKYKENTQRMQFQLEEKIMQINSMVTSDKVEELEQKFKADLQASKNEIENLQSKIEILSQSLSEKEIEIENKNVEKKQLEAHHEESLKCMKDKLQNAEKNYSTQMEEMKIKINQLEQDNSNLTAEKEKLLCVKSQFEKMKNGEDKIQSELKSKEEQLKLLQEKFESSNKEQIEKIHSFQENMKDKDNMILKLKNNLEVISKEHSEKMEEYSKRIKRLEIEREQLMLQAQERVSATEAKCREDIKTLQEKYDKLLLENNEIEKLQKQIGVLNTRHASANKEISQLKDQLADAKNKLTEVEKNKVISESELSTKLEKLQQENKQLLYNSDHVEKLKAEKEELNEKLKTAVQQVNKINVLEIERDHLRKENEELSKEVHNIRTAENETTSLRERLKILDDNESAMKKHIDELTIKNEHLNSEILTLKDSFKNEKDTLELENNKLLNRIQQLETCVSDPQNTSVKDYVEALKQEYEMALKAKDDDMLSKLKQLVRDFSIQMDVKDKDAEQMISDLLEKNQYLEEKLQREHAIEIAALRQDLFEKDCALEEMRDNYEETILEKNTKLKEQELLIKSLTPKDNLTVPTESFHNASEHSDWDDSWVVPDEVVENSSQNAKACDQHEQQITSLQEELSKCNSEIKELKVLLRLSPPDTMVNNNNRRDSVQSIPEPTEFEYLKNIIYEYMMGKEPVTLAKVIAAVLRFNDVQTQQVIRREEARHPTK